MKTILVPVDFSNVTEAVIETAKQFGRAFGSRIVLLHVVELNLPPIEFSTGIAVPVSTSPDVPLQSDVEWAREKLGKEKDRFAGTTLDVTMRVAEGEVLSIILEESRIADLIIIGSHGHGALYNLLAGSITSGVLKSAKIPVLVVPSPGK